MAVTENYQEEFLYYTIDGFSCGNMDHLFSSRIGWNQDHIFQGVEKIFALEDEKIYRASQVHGDDILIVDEQNFEDVKSREVDGLITNIQGVALTTYHADCTPIYFYDREKEVIGMAHAGWRGTLKNLAKKMVTSMGDGFSSRPEDIMVAIGPSICRDCYEVKEDVSTKFQDKYGGDVMKYDGSKIYLDLWKINEINLLSAGIKKENISISEFCTSCNTDKLYSYRKENGIKDRMVASIMIKNK